MKRDGFSLTAACVEAIISLYLRSGKTKRAVLRNRPPERSERVHAALLQEKLCETD
jgi:hypothetical protein